MSFDPTQLLLGLILGSIGMGVFIYGKNAAKLKCIVIGLVLMIVPMFISTVWADCLLGAACMLGLWLIPGGG